MSARASILIPVRRLYGYFAACKGMLVGAVLSSAVAQVAATFVLAQALSEVTSAVLGGGAQALAGAIARFALWQIPLAALTMLGVYLRQMATVRAACRLRGEVMDALLAQPMADALAMHSGDKLSALANDVPAATDSLVDAVTLPVQCLLMGISGLAYVVAVDPRLGLVTLGLGLFFLAYSLFFAGKLRRASARVQQAKAEGSVQWINLLHGMKTARMYGMIPTLVAGFERSSAAVRDAGVHWANLSAMLGGLNNFSHNLAAKIIIFAAGLLLFEGAMPVATLMGVSQVAGSAAGVFGVARSLAQVAASLAGAERLFALLDAPRSPAPARPGRVPAPTDPAVVFDRVSFGYTPAQQVLRGFSLTVAPGEIVALVGESGAGKSTLLRLLQGFYAPTGGTITLLGRPLERWDEADLRAACALVPQQPTLFPGTIYDNIALGDPAVTPEAAAEAARLADVDGFIRSLPQGYDTPVSEGGASLSGGQRQRIAIARALARPAPVVLLDEATSALDAVSERAVADTLARLRGERTLLIVAHRPATIALADRVVRVG